MFTRFRLFVLILSHINPVQTLQSWFFNIHFNIIPSTPSFFQLISYFQVSPSKLCIHFSFPLYFCRHPPPPHLILLDWLARIFVEEKSLCSSLCIILQTPFIYCFLPPVFLCALFANILSLRSSPNDRSKFTPL